MLQVTLEAVLQTLLTAMRDREKSKEQVVGAKPNLFRGTVVHLVVGNRACRMCFYGHAVNRIY